MPTKTKTNLATADTAITTEDAAINIAVLSNDSVPASLVKTLYSLAQSGSGVMTTATSKLGATITINPNGTVHYDPTSVATIQALAQGETITDSFIYTMKESTHSGNTVAFGTATVTVTLTGVNDAPVINGTAAGQTTTDTTPISPFSHAAITDVDHGAQDSLTIKVTDAGGNPTDANGMLSGSGLLKAGVGTYSFFPMSPGNLTSELDQLVFTPTAHQAAAGTTVTTKFSLAANDGFATTSDATTSVLTTQTAPKIVDYSLTLIDVPNVLTTIPNAINNDDEVAGEYEVNVSSTTTPREGFTSLNGMITPAVYPGALETTVFGINDSGDIAGLWVAPSAPENGDGFIEHGGIFTDIAPIGTANFADAGKINKSQVAIGDMSSNNGGATFGFS